MNQCEKDLRDLLKKLNQILSLESIDDKTSDAITETMLKCEDILWAARKLSKPA